MNTTSSGPASSEDPLARSAGLDRFCGAFLAGLGTLILVATRNLMVSNGSDIGPGYFPRLCGIVLVVIGVLVAALTFRRFASPNQANSYDPDTVRVKKAGKLKQHVGRALTITLSLVLFMLLLDKFGLFVSAIVLILIASYGSRELNVGSAFILALAFASLTSVIFIYGLGLPISSFPNLFD